VKRKSYFKIIYWILISIIGAGLIAAAGVIVTGQRIDPEFPISFMFYFIIVILAVIAFTAAISIFIYKDASRRNMDPWMWMTVVLFVPNLIGLIIYLIVRKENSGNRKKCINCGKPVNFDYNICPYCGADLSLKCPECGREISSEWQLCPYCSKNLEE
jgi:RNA polymerase subunit RPABC4/transcription elongation factor Spt4